MRWIPLGIAGAVLVAFVGAVMNPWLNNMTQPQIWVWGIWGITVLTSVSLVALAYKDFIAHGFANENFPKQAGRIVAKLARKGWSASIAQAKVPRTHYLIHAVKQAPLGYEGHCIVHILRGYGDGEDMYIGGCWDISQEWEDLVPKIPDSVKQEFLGEAEKILQQSDRSFNLAWEPKELRFELKHKCDNGGDGRDLTLKAGKIMEWQQRLDGVIRRYFHNETDITPPPALFLVDSKTFSTEPLKRYL